MSSTIYMEVQNAIGLGGAVWLGPSGTLMWRSDDDFETWTAVEISPGYFSSGSLVKNPDGTLYWAAGIKPSSEADITLDVRRSDDDGVSWTNPVTVATFAGGPAAGAIRIGISSAAAGTYLWWVAREIGAEAGAGYLRVTRSRDGGATFDPPASWSTTNIPARPNNPVLVADSNGAVHMFWGLSVTDTGFGYLQRHAILP